MVTTAAHKLATTLKKEFGEDSVMMASEMKRYPAITSGSLALDFAVGIGGLPTDRVIELAGAEGTGKTTLALLVMQQFLAAQPDRAGLILDLEHKLDSDWLKFLLGDDLVENRIIYIQPDHIEGATNILKKALASGDVCCAILDSIGGAPTIRRNDDAQVASFGGNSQGAGEFARAAATFSAKYQCLTIGINQVRADMSGYNRHMTPGGVAWKFAVALRLLLKRITKSTVTQKVNGEDCVIGYEVACKVVKSSLSPQGRTASWWFYNVPTEEYGFGIDTLEEIIRLGILTNVIARKGGWYHHPLLPEDKGEHKILGRDRLMEHIRSDVELQAALSKEITANLAEHASDVAPISNPDDDIEDKSHFAKINVANL